MPGDTRSMGGGYEADQAMRKKKRLAMEQEHAALLSRELSWIEASARHATKIIFGAPMRCPDLECGDFGLVEAVVQGRQFNRCWSCGTEWTLSTQAMALFAQACRPQPESTIVGAGTLVADLEPAHAARTTLERFIGVREARPHDSPIGYLPN